MRDSLIEHLISEGVPPDEARTRAEAALNTSPVMSIPTFEELDAMIFPPEKLLGIDVDWSDCPLVQRHRDYLGGALAMKSSPRMPIEGRLIVNYNGGYSPEELSTMFACLDVEEVRAIITYATERS
jgi:hypothetical protein